MKEHEFFESVLKGKVADARIMPTDKVWERIYDAVQKPKYSKGFYIIVILGCFFTHSWINTGESALSLPVIHFQKQLSEKTSFAKINSGHVLKANKDNSQKASISSNLKSIKQIAIQTDRSLSFKPGSDIRFISHSKYFSKPDLNIISKKVFNLSGTAANQGHSQKIDRIYRKKKFALNFYITPSISYRFLNNNNNPEYRYTNPEKMVSHHSAAGMELGVALIKPINRKWNFKTGVQLNFSRYEIRAMQTFNELLYVRTNTGSVFVENSNVGNRSGIKPKKLMNENLQISVPVGLEYKLKGNSRFAYYISGTLQPSYSVYAGGYMVTSNYKNYIQADHIFRRFNIQGGMEAFCRINMGQITIQAGPQIRYQLLSNTIEAYPIKEHLIDYGFKVGVVTTIP